MAVSVLCFFLVVPGVSLWPVIVTFPGHTYLLFVNISLRADVSVISGRRFPAQNGSGGRCICVSSALF